MCIDYAQDSHAPDLCSLPMYIMYLSAAIAYASASLYFVYWYGEHVYMRSQRHFILLCSLSLMLDVVMVQPLRVYLFRVQCAEAVELELSHVHAQVRNRARTVFKRKYGYFGRDSRGGCCISEYFNGAVRVAKSQTSLVIFRLILELNDYDINRNLFHASASSSSSSSSMTKQKQQQQHHHQRHDAVAVDREGIYTFKSTGDTNRDVSEALQQLRERREALLRDAAQHDDAADDDDAEVAVTKTKWMRLMMQRLRHMCMSVRDALRWMLSCMSTAVTGAVREWMFHRLAFRSYSVAYDEAHRDEWDLNGLERWMHIMSLRLTAMAVSMPLGMQEVVLDCAVSIVCVGVMLMEWHLYQLRHQHHGHHGYRDWWMLSLILPGIIVLRWMRCERDRYLFNAREDVLEAPPLYANLRLRMLNYISKLETLQGISTEQLIAQRLVREYDVDDERAAAAERAAVAAKQAGAYVQWQEQQLMRTKARHHALMHDVAVYDDKRMRSSNSSNRDRIAMEVLGDDAEAQAHAKAAQYDDDYDDDEHDDEEKNDIHTQHDHHHHEAESERNLQQLHHQHQQQRHDGDDADVSPSSTSVPPATNEQSHHDDHHDDHCDAAAAAGASSASSSFLSSSQSRSTPCSCASSHQSNQSSSTSIGMSSHRILTQQKVLHHHDVLEELRHPAQTFEDASAVSAREHQRLSDPAHGAMLG